MSVLPVVARGGRKGLAGADLSKTQGGDEFLLLHFCRFFFIFSKKVMPYVEYPEHQEKN